MHEQITRIAAASRSPLLTVLDGIDRATLDWRPAPDSRSIGEILRHVLRVDNLFLRRLDIVPEVDDPGEADAAVIGEALRRQHAQLDAVIASFDEEGLARPATAGAKPGESCGDVIVHMAQHHLYHLAQIAYLRRALDREWTAPLDAWEHATHLIGGAVLRSGR